MSLIVIICIIVSLYGFIGVAYEGNLSHCKGRIDPFWRFCHLNGIIVLSARGRPSLCLVVLGSTGQSKVRVVGEAWCGLLLNNAAAGLEIFLEPAPLPLQSLIVFLLLRSRNNNHRVVLIHLLHDQIFLLM